MRFSIFQFFLKFRNVVEIYPRFTLLNQGLDLFMNEMHDIMLTQVI